VKKVVTVVSELVIFIVPKGMNNCHVKDFSVAMEPEYENVRSCKKIHWLGRDRMLHRIHNQGKVVPVLNKLSTTP
jgi:hypothetical protein